MSERQPTKAASPDAAYTKGCEGWFRWGSWSAHFFVSGDQLCHTQHVMLPRPQGKQPPKPAELNAHGVPFGRVCSFCLKRSRELRRAS